MNRISSEQGEKTAYHDFMWFLIQQYRELRNKEEKAVEREKQPENEGELDFQGNSYSFESDSKDSVELQRERSSFKSEKWPNASLGVPCFQTNNSASSVEAESNRPSGFTGNAEGEKHGKGPETGKSQRNSIHTTSFQEEEEEKNNEDSLGNKAENERELVDGLLQIIKELHEGIVMKVLESRRIPKEAVQYSKIIGAVSKHARRVIGALLMDDFIDYWEAIGIKIPNETQEKGYSDLRKRIKVIQEKSADDENEAMEFCKAFFKTVEIAKSTAKIIGDLSKTRK